MSREIAKAEGRAGAVRIVDEQRVPPRSATRATLTPPVFAVADQALAAVDSEPDRLAVDQGDQGVGLVSGPLIASKAPSLKIGQFW